jgi:acyl carrier protein
MKEIYSIIAQIIKENFNIQVIEEDFECLFDDIGLDELDVLELKMLLEEKYDISIPEDDSIQTLDDLIKFIENS